MKRDAVNSLRFTYALQMGTLDSDLRYISSFYSFSGTIPHFILLCICCSYGIETASAAGIPQVMIDEARRLRQSLVDKETQQQRRKKEARGYVTISFFSFFSFSDTVPSPPPPPFLFVTSFFCLLDRLNMSWRGL